MQHHRLKALLVCFLSALLTAPLAVSGAEAQTAQFTTSDDVEIAASYWPAEAESAPAVILLHMEKQDRQSWAPLVPVLHEAGFAVLALDLRGHGGSVPEGDDRLRQRIERNDQRMYQAMHRDVAAAYGWLAEQPGVDLARIALVGAGAGAAVAVDYAVRDKSIDAVVLMTPAENILGLDCAEDLQNYGERPVLMLAAEEDRAGAEALEAVAADAEVKTFGESQIRGTAMFGKVPNVERTLAEWVKRAVGDSSEQVVYASITSEVYHRPDSPAGKRIKPGNRRLFSSPAEAEQRGYRAAQVSQKKPAEPPAEPSDDKKDES